MLRKWAVSIALLAAIAGADAIRAEDGLGGQPITGSVTDGQAKPLHGVMITAFDAKEDKSISVFSQMDGKFSLPAMPARDYKVRARLIGLEDETREIGSKDLGQSINFTMKPAEDLQSQRRGFERINLLKFENEQDRLTFRMTCTYCHQCGTLGFRAPDQLVDWEVMLTQVMAGPDGQGSFRTLPKHLQQALPKMLFETYGGGAEEKWPAFTPPPAPEGESLNAVITEWPLGQEDRAMMHDLELGRDGLIYTIDSTNDCLLSLNPKTGERKVHAIPGGKTPMSDEPPVKAPHSIEEDHDGNMWVTLCYGKEMARFNEKTHEFLLIPSGAGGKKGGYPHTLRFDQNGICWYTDAALNSVFRLDPKTLEIKQYKLLAAHQAQNPPKEPERNLATVAYGLSIAPDGKVWYTKLNGQRVGVIDPLTDQLTEWKPPVHGPRRLEVAADGIVWIPGYASGDICSYNPKTNEWKNFELPGQGEDLPYALSVHPTTGEVWVCGTNSDTMMRLDPKTGKVIAVYRMPTNVTYTREVEFGPDGAMWTCNSNLPARHVEHHRGAIIKIEVPEKTSKQVSQVQ